MFEPLRCPFQYLDPFPLPAITSDTNESIPQTPPSSLKGLVITPARVTLRMSPKQQPRQYPCCRCDCGRKADRCQDNQPWRMVPEPGIQHPNSPTRIHWGSKYWIHPIFRIKTPSNTCRLIVSLGIYDEWLEDLVDDEDYYFHHNHVPYEDFYEHFLQENPVLLQAFLNEWGWVPSRWRYAFCDECLPLLAPIHLVSIKFWTF